MADPSRTSIVDLDLRGRAVVRLVGAGPAEMRMVRRQLGPLPAIARGTASADLAMPSGPESGRVVGTSAGSAEPREPDVTIRFVDRLERDGPVRRLGPDAQAVGHAFVLTRGRRTSQVRVEVPVASLGSGPATLVAERGGRSIPLLLPILAASLLARGVAAAHASAFVVDGHGVFVSGWAKGGKSETLLAFLIQGARYVGDEWLFVDPDGPSMFGPPEPIRLWDWQLAQVPTLRARVGRSDRVRLGGAGGLAHLLGGIGRAPAVGGTAVGEAARRAGAVVDRQRSTQFAVEELFGPAAIHAQAASIDRVVLVAGSNEDSVRAGVRPDEAAARIAATTVHELLDLQALRLAYRHAFPDQQAEGLEDLEARLRAVYELAFGNVPIIEVRHRHPPDIAALHGLIGPEL